MNDGKQEYVVVLAGGEIYAGILTNYHDGAAFLDEARYIGSGAMDLNRSDIAVVARLAQMGSAAMARKAAQGYFDVVVVANVNLIALCTATAAESFASLSVTA